MNAEQITTIITNLLTGGGIVFFLGMWIRALRKQLDVQKNTLEAVKTQVSETQKIGDIYRKLFEELPTEAEKWKVTILKFKDERIAELEKAIQDKDEKHTNTVKIEIQELDRKYQALEDIPKLLGQVTDTARILEQTLSTTHQLVAYNEPALNDWINKGSTLQAMMNKESALYLLLSALAENDRKVVLAVWRFLDAGAKPTTLREIASKLNLNEFVVSNALDRLIRQNCAEMIVSAEEPTKYIALAPSQ